MPDAVATRRTDRLRSVVARLCFARPRRVSLARPIVSFNFDDFPQSAVDNAAPIFSKRGCRATFYLSTSLFGYEDQAGRYVDEDSVRALIAAGHDIGCHTHGHIDLLHCSRGEIAADLERYRQAFAERFGDRRAATFSYPYGRIGLLNKLFLARRFDVIRGIRAGINHGVCDLAQLRANEIRGPEPVEHSLALIEENARQKGLLIFFTHDVRADPSDHGCRPDDLETVVTAAIDSGADVMTMSDIAARFQGSARSARTALHAVGNGRSEERPCGGDA